MRPLTIALIAFTATPLLFTQASFANGEDLGPNVIKVAGKSDARGKRPRKSNLPGVGTKTQNKSDIRPCQNHRLLSDSGRAQCNTETRIFNFDSRRRGS